MIEKLKGKLLVVALVLCDLEALGSVSAIKKCSLLHLAFGVSVLRKIIDGEKLVLKLGSLN